MCAYLVQKLKNKKKVNYKKLSKTLHCTVLLRAQIALNAARAKSAVAMPSREQASMTF